jgi:hypothetical protein
MVTLGGVEPAISWVRTRLPTVSRQGHGAGCRNRTAWAHYKCAVLPEDYIRRRAPAESRTPISRVRTECSSTSASGARWPRLDSNQHATRAPRSEHGGSTKVPPRGQTVGLVGVEPTLLPVPNRAAYHQALSPLINAGAENRTPSLWLEARHASIDTSPAQRRAWESNPAGLSTLPRFQRGCAPCFSLSRSAEETGIEPAGP